MTKDEIIKAIANGISLRGAYLRGAYLRGADLREADLRNAHLRNADLTRASLTRADLREANLTMANLTMADLKNADLTMANLTRADLTMANLTRADLTGADLREADLREADLRDAYLRGADLRGAKLPSNIPVIDDIHNKVHEATRYADSLNMSAWYSRCGTTHCRAGHVVRLAGDAGYELENKYGPAYAAALIYMASDPTLEAIPDFHANNKDTLIDIARLANK